MRWRTLLLATLLVTGGLSLAPQTARSAPPKTSGPPQPSLLLDVNATDPAGSTPQVLTAVGSAVYFQADDGVHGIELWKTDGAGKGATRLVKDIRPGNASAFERISPRPMVAVGQTVFFIANDGVHGYELWKSDGTSEGTMLVKDIRTGSFESLIYSLTASSGAVFFAAIDDVHGIELWKSDGTEAGTVLVKDIRPGSGWSVPTQLTDWSGTLFFSVDDGLSGRELWRSDGSAAGTVLVKDIRPGVNSSFPSRMTVSGGKLFFSANGPSPDGETIGEELWKTDGTASGTAPVTDIRPGQGNSSPHNLTDVGGTLFFAADEGSKGHELWKSDGSPQGTVLVKNIRDDTLSPRSSFPAQLTKVGEVLFFVANDGIHGIELWRSDGTASGTNMIVDIRNGSNGFGGSRSFAVIKNTLLFGADDGVNGTELWSSDGTAAGTRMVLNINPLACSDEEFGWRCQNSGYVDGLVAAGGRVFFSANDRITGTELWRSDGTPSGTVLVKNIRSATNASSDPIHLGALGGNAIFSADDGRRGRELWRTDGTPSGTTLIKDINPGHRSSSPIAIAAVGNVLYFAADDGVHGEELWKTDGTAVGTVLVKDISSDFDESSFNSVVWSAALGDTVYFAANDGESGRELWKTDGTASGTSMVIDLNRWGSSSPSHMTGFEGSLYFSADDGFHGRELWRIDGGDPETARLFDINLIPAGAKVGIETGIYPESGLGEVDPDNFRVDGGVATHGSNPWSLTVAGSTLFFMADDGPRGHELWKLNRTAEGDSVALVKDISPLGGGGASGWDGIDVTEDGLNYLIEIAGFNVYFDGLGVGPLTAVGERVFFSANDGVHGGELWVSDGTEAGTALVKDIDPRTDCGSSECSFPYWLTEVNGVLFFAAGDQVAGRELWKSDGTESGTVLVRDINPGLDDSDPFRLMGANGQLYFIASDGLHGAELWVSDGTNLGTALISDLNPADPWSTPESLFATSSHLFFSFEDASRGREPWVLPFVK